MSATNRPTDPLTKTKGGKSGAWASRKKSENVITRAQSAGNQQQRLEVGLSRNLRDYTRSFQVGDDIVRVMISEFGYGRGVLSQYEAARRR